MGDVIDMAKVRDQARFVGEDHARHTRADELERKALILLFKEVVRTVEPALAALSSRIVARETGFWEGPPQRAHMLGPHGRGLYLNDDPIGPSKSPPRGDVGIYVGHAFFLNEAGTITIVTYGGQWDERQYYWDGNQIECSIDDAVNDHRLDIRKAITVIADALESQFLGNRAKRSADIERRAARIQALAVLLKEG